MKCLLIILVITLTALAVLTFVLFSMKANTESTEQDEYTAAVVEYHPVSTESSADLKNYMLENAHEYEQIIKNASELYADIIVFPEGGLAGTKFEKSRSFLRTNLIEVPDPHEKIAPWKFPDGAYHEVLQKISLAAHSYNIYVVINLPEKHNCSLESNCSADGFIFFNTNIVFDRHGSIIARYRKSHLFREANFSVPKPAEICTFQTDFGVTFGMIICFDILFEDPAIRLLEETNVKDIIISTAWFSEFPFLYATGVQAGWSYSMDVNLLASTLNTKTHGGSGIYAGRNGVKAGAMPREIGTKVHITKVPTWSESQKLSTKNHLSMVKESDHTDSTKMNDYFTELEYLSDPSLPFMSTKILEPSIDQVYERIDGVVFETELAYSVPEFESSIKVQWSVNKEIDTKTPRYRLFSYFGERSFSGERTGTIAVCGVVACRNEALESCGLIPNTGSSVKTTLHSVNITIRSKSITEGYIPITCDFNIGPISTEQFQFSKQRIVNSDNSREFELKMHNLQPLDDVLSFAIYKIPST